MGLEIERKFVVAEIPAVRPYSALLLTQGYLSTDPTVRVRTATKTWKKFDGRRGSVERGYLTIKGPGLLLRQEWEYEIPHAEAVEMLALCPHVLQKTRYALPSSLYGGGSALMVVDHFQDLDLIMVEVEFSSQEESEAFQPPEGWLEVTEDPAYANTSLALRPKVGAV